MVCRNKSIWCLTKFVGNLFLFRKNVTAVCVWVLLIFISRLEKGDHCSKEENRKKTNNYKRKKDRNSERKWWGDNKHWKKRKKNILYIIRVTRTTYAYAHIYRYARLRARLQIQARNNVTYTRTQTHTRTRARACARVCMYFIVDEYIHVFIHNRKRRRREGRCEGG